MRKRKLPSQRNIKMLLISNEIELYRTTTITNKWKNCWNSQAINKLIEPTFSDGMQTERWNKKQTKKKTTTTTPRAMLNLFKSKRCDRCHLYKLIDKCNNSFNLFDWIRKPEIHWIYYFIIITYVRLSMN